MDGTETEVLSNLVDAWYIMAAIERDAKPILEQIARDHGVDVTIKHYGYWGCESVAYHINGHFGYVWEFDTYEPAIRGIGFGDEPPTNPNERAAVLLLEPFLVDRLEHYKEEPIMNLANDPEIDKIFDKISNSRGC